MSSRKWKTIKLSEIAYLNYGKSLTSDIRKEGKIPVYSSSGITGWHDTALVNEDGIIIGRKGNVGSIFYADGPFYCIDTAYYIKKSELKCNIKYFYYLLKTLGLDKLNEDSAVPGLNRDTAHSQLFSYPEEIDTQRRIAEILSALDDKIELNRQTNATLEAIAQAVFKEWFVNFNFPGATGEMVESELGMIPKGWRVGKLGEFAEKITKGTTPTTLGDDFVEQGVRFFRVDCIKDNFGIDASKALFITPVTHDKLKRSQLRINDILITIAGSIGRIGIVTERNLPANLNQAIGIIRVDKNKAPVNYIYYFLKQQSIKDRLLSGVTQSVQANISLTDLSNLKIIIPPKTILGKFDIVMKISRDQIENLSEQTSSLIELRDLLLPKLMSGEIEV